MYKFYTFFHARKFINNCKTCLIVNSFNSTLVNKSLLFLYEFKILFLFFLENYFSNGSYFRYKILIVKTLYFFISYFNKGISFSLHSYANVSDTITKLFLYVHS